MMSVLTVSAAIITGAVLVWLVPENRRALASVLRPPLTAGPVGGHRMSVIAWSASLAAIFAGPAAMLLLPLTLVLSRAARRRVISVQYPDPEDLHLLSCARKNALAATALLLFVAAFVGALYLSGDAFVD